jgi:hypothetical protein
MPDSFEHMPPVAVRMPNGALASLAGNIDPHHRVAIADLILVQSTVRSTVERLVRDIMPDVVGLSVMTFQRATALKIARLIHALRPSARIVVGGYDPSLAPEVRSVRGYRLHRARRRGTDALRAVARPRNGRRLRNSGLSCRTTDGLCTTRPVPFFDLDQSPVATQSRSAGALRLHPHGRTVDVVETSRGCTYDCSFCSIIEMRGRNFHPYPIERVLADIADARVHGADSIFLVDDNITLDIERFAALCQAIIDAGFDDADYVVQGMTAPIAQHGARLGPLMRKAGFRYVFLGIENILDEDLGFLRARAKNSRRAKRAGRSETRASRRSSISTATACTSWAG